MTKQNSREAPSYTQFILQLVQNHQGRLILSLCFCHSLGDSLFGITLHFIILQFVNRLFEFLVGLDRCIFLRTSSGLQRIVNDFGYTFTKIEQCLGKIWSERITFSARHMSGKFALGLG